VGELYALMSAGGSPGVTTTAVALALTWPTAAIVAECDPSGGDVLAGVLAGHVPARQGLIEHAIEAGRGRWAADVDLAAQLVPLDAGQTKKVLPGLSDPRQAAGVAAAWPAVLKSLANQRADVIADCGRLDAGEEQPRAVLAAADVVAIVLRPTLRQVWSAQPRIGMRERLRGSRDQLGLLVVGRGTHSAREIVRALGVPVLAVLPFDARTASVLSDGHGARQRLIASPLMKSAPAAGKVLRQRVHVCHTESAEMRTSG